MLRAIIAFVVLSVAGLILGYTGLAGFTLDIGRVVLGAFLILAFAGVAIGFVEGGSPRDVA